MADFWSGYLSGAVSIIIGNPLDLLKVRLQASSPSTTTPKPSTRTSSPQTRIPLLKDGTHARTLLAGLPAPIATYGALNAVLFSSYNRSLAYFSPALSRGDGISRDRYGLSTHFIAGTVAGLATWPISTPTELVKCRAQTAGPGVQTSTTPQTPRVLANSITQSSYSVIRGTFAQSGIHGFFLGGNVTAARDGIGYGFYFATYEGCRRFLGRYGGAWRSEAYEVLLSGGVAGIATWASVFPLDMVKTRVQTQRVVNGERVRGAVEIAKEAYQDSQLAPNGRDNRQESGGFARRLRGLRVFFNGIGICCARAFVVNAVQWAVYEWAMRKWNAS